MTGDKAKINQVVRGGRWEWIAGAKDNLIHEWDRMFVCPCKTKSREECQAYQKRLFKAMLIFVVLVATFSYWVGCFMGKHF
jgi:hypothetical protein